MVFRGEYAFLSNFYPAQTSLKGKVFGCVEVAYQWAKACSGGQEAVAEAIWNGGTHSPASAKRLGKTLALTSTWAVWRVEIMTRLVTRKFAAHPDLCERLRALEGPIVEETTWHDTFWGVCVCSLHTGRGANTLGHILQDVRLSL